ncbi:hypothetical protein PACTADRAFT_1133 [Pachysolen tannophilus NRRL Y-2460]|uniref:Uncharacterized protein n=1 Tax=Pachysolen tannophilus NRRL Y-2460 TaxID=669874 RepID=A0A1E4TXR3_PACTA|nr:hypothetical protein PACTADRAFT_1133 [Pachysolen tannophilus NRRL Y-2460]
MSDDAATAYTNNISPGGPNDINNQLSPGNSTEKITDHTTERANSTATRFYHDKHNIYINDVPINKDDFMYAFGGNLNPGLQTIPERKFGNPVPAGLCAFSLACFTLGLIDAGARSVSNPSILVGAFFFSAGIVEGIAGIWCLIVENTWAGTVLLIFFGFWTSYGAILTDAFGIQSAYTTTDEFDSAMGLFLSAYVIFGILIWLCTFKSTWALFLLFFDIWFFILLLDIGTYTGNTNVSKAGGAFCFLAGLLGFYNAFAGMADDSNSYFIIKPWFMPGAIRPTSTKEDIEAAVNS